MKEDDRNPAGFRAVRIGLSLTTVAVFLTILPYSIQATDVKWPLLAVAAPILTVLLWVASVFGRTPLTRPGPLVTLLGMALCLNLAAALHSPYALHSLAFVARQASLFSLAYLAQQAIRSEAELRRLLWVVCVTALGASGYGAMQYLGYDPFPWDEAQRLEEAYSRIPATYGNANYAAHVLGLCMLACVFLSRGRAAFVTAPMLLAFGLHLWVTDQRGMPLALAAASIFTLVVLSMRRFGRTAQRVLMGSLLALPLVLLGPVLLGLLAIAPADGVLPLDGSILLRYNAYHGASRMIAAAPGLGFGPGNYAIANAAYWTDYERRVYAEAARYNEHAHNDLIEAAVDAGLGGALLYLALFAAPSMGALRFALRAAPGTGARLFFLAFFVAFFVDGCFGFNGRLPVSGLLLAFLCGAHDSIAARPGQVSRRGAATAVALVLLAIGLPAACAQCRDFAGSLAAQLGRARQAQGAPQAAKEAFARAERYRPWDWLAPWRCGILLEQDGARDEAAAAFERALARHPNFLPARVALVRVLLEQAARREAVEAAALLDRIAAQLEEAEARCPECSETLEPAARFHLERARGLDGAERDRALRQAMDAATAGRVHAQNGGEELRLLQARIRTEQGDLAGSLAIYRELVKTDAENTAVWRAYYEFTRPAGGRAFREDLDRSIEARLVRKRTLSIYMAALERCRIATPESLAAGVELVARFTQSQAPNAEVREDVALALDLLADEMLSAPIADEERGALLAAAARVAVAAGCDEAAFRVYNAAYEPARGSTKSEAALFVAQTLANRGKHAEALALLDDALAHSPADLALLVSRARALAKLGRTNEAREAYLSLVQTYHLPGELQATVMDELRALGPA